MTQNKTTEALRLAEEARTPLKDLLRAVPKNGSDLYEEDKFCHHNIPYGRLIHEALAEIERLEALAEPQITTPDVCGEVCARAKLCYGCGKALDEANAKHEALCEDEGCPHHGTPHICFSDPSVLDKPFACETGECPDKSLCAGACECLYKAEPVQEPVYAFRRRGLDDFCTCTKERYDELVDKPNLFEVTTFYAAQVSAKREWVDLTDDEATKAYMSDEAGLGVTRLHAVIAAFKEKNK